MTEIYKASTFLHAHDDDGDVRALKIHRTFFENSKALQKSTIKAISLKALELH